MKKRYIILQSILVVILLVSFYFINNYQLYTKYLEELKYYEYDEEVFNDNNILVKIETVNYIKFELDKTINESNRSIEILNEKFPEFAIEENLKLYKKVDFGNQFMDYKIEQLIKTIQIDSPNGDNVEQLINEKEEYTKTLNELSSYADKSLSEKITIYEKLSKLQLDVDIYNQKLSENSEEQDTETEEETEETDVETYTPPENNYTSQSQQVEEVQPQPAPVICEYSSRSEAVTAGKNSGRGWIVRECDNGTWEVELFQIIGGGDECEVLCYEDE